MSNSTVTTVDCPNLRSDAGNPVGIESSGGSYYVDKVTGEKLETSGTHTTQFGGGDSSSDEGGIIDHIVDNVIDAVTDSCLLM